ncbi:MAG: hypothetical protein CMO81_01970 [Waddliaceae bacterium]|nr:hypothetical protein [Waddliaceae bacterium]
MQNNLQVRAGVGVLIFRDKKILLGLRQGSHGEGTWSPPGGHLDFGESVEDCAARELFEETALKATMFTPLPWSNDIFEEEKKHYLTAFIRADDVFGEPELCEPDKCISWEWFSIDELPKKMFFSLRNLINRYSIDVLLSKAENRSIS